MKADVIDIKFWVPGNPKGLKRHRSTKSGHQYDPSKADKADFLAKCMQHRPAEPIREPLYITLVCVFPRPQAHLRKDGAVKPDAPKWHASTPDIDNVMKMVGDSLNGIFWHDDRQIVSAHIDAVYGEAPGIAVRIQCPDDYDYKKAHDKWVDIADGKA